MTIKIGSNIGSLLAQRKLGENRNVASTAQERLSTGMRINRAADDAAGLHIASRLNSDVRVYNQARRNINDGISVFNVMEQAVAALQTITQRQKELAEQSANGILTSRQRLLVHQEARALSLEYERIIQGTEFNGRKLFDDDNRQFSIQAGIGNNEILEFEFAKELTRTVGDGTFEELYTYNVGRDPNSIITADFNNDGILDLAVSNQRDNNIGILLGNADGSFQNQITSSTGSRPNSLQAGDFNNDGILDLANNDFGNSGLGETVSIVFGNGDGTFSGRVTIETGVGPTALAVGDVDNDGNLDITAATGSANFLSGLPERFRVTTPTNGTTESTEVTFVDAPESEVTTISTIAANTSVSEVTAITTDDGAVQEISTITAIDANTSIQEISTVGADAGAVQEITEITAIQADNSVQEISTVTADAGAVQEITEITAIQADNSVQEISTITADAIATQEQTDITLEAASNMTSGDYFEIDSPDGNFYVWYNIDGAGSDPAVGGRTGIEVAVSSADNAIAVASATQSAIDARSEFSASVLGDTISVTNTSGGSVTDAQDGTIGGAFSVNVTTQGTDSDIANGSYFTLDSPDTEYYFWFDINNSGSDPSVAGKTGIEINVNWGDSSTTVANAIQSAIDAQGDFGASVLGSDITVTNADGGVSTDITKGDITGSTFAVATTQQGVDSDLQSGDYFFLSSPETDYYVWFNVDGAGADPSVGGRTGIEVALNSADSANTVASKIETAVGALGDFGANAIGDTITITNTHGGTATNASDQTVGGSFATATTQAGVDSDIENGDYFTFDTPNNSYYVWFDYNNTATDPTVAGRTGVEVDISYGDSANSIASSVQAAIDALGDVGASVLGSDVTITNTDGGVATNITKGSITGVDFTVATTQQGTDSDLQSGDYFFLSSPDTDYYVWFNVDGAGADPSVGGRTGIEVALNSADSANTVASKIETAVGALGDFGASAIGDTITVTNTHGGVATNASDQTVGGSFATATTQAGVDSDIENGDYFTFDTPTNSYYVWFDYNNTATDPTVGGRTGVEVDISYGDSANSIAASIQAAVDALGDVGASVLGSDVTITNADGGTTANITKGNITGSSFTVTTTQEGANSNILSGDYFFLSSPDTDYYVWFNVDGAGSDPSVGGRTGIEVALNFSDNANTVATKIETAIGALADFSANAVGDTITITNTHGGVATNISDQTVGGSFATATTQAGTDSDIENGDYFTLDTPTNSYYVWFDYNNTATDPSVAGRTGIEVDLNYGDSASTIASKLQTTLAGQIDLNASVLGSAVTVTNVDGGAVTNATNGNIAGGTFGTSVTTEGVDSDMQSGDYFFLSSPSTNYYVWFNVDGAGGDPSIVGRTGIEVAVNYSDSDSTVASKLSSAIDALGAFSAGSVGNSVTVTNTVGGVATNGSEQTVGGSFGVSTSNEGTNSIFGNGDYFIVDSPGTDYYVWFNYGGASDPLVGGRTGLEINANYDDSASTLASLTAAALNARAEFNASAVGDTLTINNTQLGTEGVATGSIASLSFSVTQTGTYPVINSGQYFTFNTPNNNYYAWYNVDGAGGDPNVIGRTGIEINISNGDTGDSIASTTAITLAAVGDINATASGSNVTVTNDDNGEVTNATNVNVGSLSVNTLQDGTETRVNIVNDSINAPGHGFQTGLEVSLVNGGTLPGGLNTVSNYFLIAVDNDTIAFATSEANALADNRIDLTSFGAGIHSIIAEGQTSGGGFSFGNGDGTFGNTTAFSAGQLPSAFELADFNSDGNLDLAVAEQKNDNIEILIGDGSGSFSLISQVSVGSNPSALFITDIDLDGAVDILSADTGANQISVLTGNNSGAFTQTGYATIGNAPSDIFAIDLNGDNLKDIITTDFDSNTGTGGTIFFTNSNGSVSQFASFTAGIGARQVTGADYNGDGVNDLAIANDNDETVSILITNTKQSSIAQFYDLTTQSSSREALDALNEQSNRLSQGLAYIGSSQARLEIANSNIGVKISEYQSAINRIQDADIAVEAANLVKARIQEQVTAQVLKIANLNYDLVLELLK